MDILTAMKSKRTQVRLTSMACLATLGCLVVHGAWANEENPYSVIVDRNIFHLNPEPVVSTTPEVKPPDLPKVMLDGFMGKGNLVKVLFAIPGKDAKATPTYLTLALGEKGGDSEGHSVELRKINPDQSEVEIINSGTLQTLNVKSNGYVASAAPAGPPGHGGPGGPPGPGGLPGLHRGPPGFSLPAPTAPHAGNTIQPRSENSAVIAGNPTGSGSGVISAGGGGYGNPGQANAVGNQIANALNGNGQNRIPTASNPNAVPVPVEVQAASMLINEAAGGPPSPVNADGSSRGEAPSGPPQVPH